MHYKGNYWTIAENRRNTFIELAHEKGFDPLVPENWQNIKYDELPKVNVNLKAVVWVKSNINIFLECKKFDQIS